MAMNQSDFSIVVVVVSLVMGRTFLVQYTLMLYDIINYTCTMDGLCKGYSVRMALK